MALKRLAPIHIDIIIGSIAELPLFNPDRKSDSITALNDLISSLKQSDGLIIASPEYAHGISGPMKNALDWLVSCTEFPHKPIMLINTSPRASHAQQALKEVLVTMSGIIVEELCLTIPLLSSELDVEGIIKNKAISDALSLGLKKFYTEIK